MAIAGYWLPALRRWLLSVVLLSLLMPLGGVGQPRQLGHQLAWISAAQLIDQTKLPAQLLATELLAAEALGYAAGTEKSRPRPAPPRVGSWWAWLSTAGLALLLLRVGLALRAARRFNRELTTQVGYLSGQLAVEAPPTLALVSFPAPLAESDLKKAAAAEVLVDLGQLAIPDAGLEEHALVPRPELVPAPQQQALHELRQAAEAALDDADFGPAQLAELLAVGERTLYRHVKEVAGLTPAAYLRELRLQHAHHLLSTQACPSVSEVAYQSGFNDPSYFGQVFQKRFGKKPSAYL